MHFHADKRVCALCQLFYARQRTNDASLNSITKRVAGRFYVFLNKCSVNMSTPYINRMFNRIDDLFWARLPSGQPNDGYSSASRQQGMRSDMVGAIYPIHRSYAMRSILASSLTRGDICRNFRRFNKI